MLGQVPAPQSTTTPSGSNLPSSTDLAQESGAVDSAAQAAARADLDAAEHRGALTADQANTNARSQALSESAVVAVIAAPASVDANGKDVATNLKVEGDIVTRHVDHQDQAVAYPIAADPIVTLETVQYRVAYYPVMRQETYVSGWRQQSTYVGQWHPIYCTWGMTCTAAGNSWFGISYQGGTYLAYWPGWAFGPAFQLSWVPTYATRSVLDHWQPYWEPYIVTSSVWADGEDSETAALEGVDAFGWNAATARSAPAAQLTTDLPDDSGDDPGDPQYPASSIVDPGAQDGVSTGSAAVRSAAADVSLGSCGSLGTVLPARAPGTPTTTLFTWQWTDTGQQSGRAWVKIQFDVRTLLAYRAKARWAGLALSAEDALPNTNRSFPFTTSTTRDRSRPAKQPWYYHASLKVWKGSIVRARGKARHTPVTTRVPVAGGTLVYVTTGGNYPRADTTMYKCTVA